MLNTDSTEIFRTKGARMKKIGTMLLACAMLGTMGLGFAGCSSAFYSEEQHIQRVTERAEKRFLGEGSEYTGLEVYPLYNEYDELRYMLIEFEPQGFVYVAISDRAYPWKGMYTLSTAASESWMPYRVKKGAREEVSDEDGNVITYFNREFFRDENGDVIVYHRSHFKVAGIENERRYLLTIEQGGSTSCRIPAVRRGDQYLDLVDGALIDYSPGMQSETYATGNIVFIGKSYFDL